MLPTVQFGVFSFIVIMMSAAADDISLTKSEKDYIKTMHSRICGSERMCSRSDKTEEGDCRICPGCRCDDLCNKYGDCCADKTVDLLDNPNFNPSRYRCHSNSFKLIYDRKPEFSFHSIQKCSLRADGHLVQLCENPDPRNITLAVPAKTEYDLYRNQFCAECNGEREYTLWDIKAECTQLVWLKSGMTSLQIIQSFIDDIGCAVFLRPAEGTDYRKCYTPEDEMISNCTGSAQLKELDGDTEKLCHSYSSPVHLYDNVYRNVFCYMCNHGSLDGSFIPAPSCPFDTPYPFSVILDPKAIQIIRETVSLSCECDPGYIYSRHTEECKLIECTADRILQDETCFSVIRSAKGLVYLLEVLLKPDSSLKVSTNINVWITGTASKLKNHMRKLIGEFVGVGQFRVGVRVENPLGSENEIKSISIHSKFLIRLESEVDQMESTLLELRQKDWIIELDNSNVTFKAEPYWTDPDHVTLYPTVTEDNIDEENSIFRLDHGLTVNLTRKHKALYVSETLKCPRVKVYQDIDYIQDEDSNTWKYIGSNETLDMSQFEPSSNNSGYVCYSAFIENTTNCGRSEFLSPAKLFPSPLIYVSLVCQVLSLLCLFATFLVFCILKSLRTLPGKNTMSLVFTLFVAIFLYTTGSARVEDKVICKVVGISIHFFLLSSFTWMAVCTVHMFTVFRNILLSRHSDTSNTKKYILYLIVSIILPGIIVGATVAGNYFISNGQDIGYGINICYVSNFYTVLLAVGAPVVIVMSINGGLFTATVIALRKTAKLHEELKTKKTSISMYVKLSTLTGINWFFALVSVLVDSDVFKYIFVVLCALQGVYIFVSFVCTRKVLHLLRDCCKNKGNTKNAADIKIKMTFNGKELEIEELDQDKDPDYASIKDMKDGKLWINDTNEDDNEVGGANSDSVSDIDSMKCGVHTLERGSGMSDDEPIHEVDMHNAGCDEGDYGLLMHATTKEVRDPCNVMFNPVFQ